LAHLRDSPPLICLVTPGHAASTPRLVRNADALSEAGYRVHVVAGRHFPQADALDAELFRRAIWTYTQVGPGSGARALVRKAGRQLARAVVTHPRFASIPIAARAFNSESARLAAAAAQVSADFYLGHCLAGLPAAAFAAKQRGVPYGFDAEDFHDAETEASMADRADSTARRVLQSALLPGCSHLTAASPLIGAQFESTYGVSPSTLLNVFPVSEGPHVPADPGPVTEERAARFYWFSQTIGPGRGLESVIRIMGRMRTPSELHLRGFVSADYMSELRSLSRQAGVARDIHFLPPGSPAEMPLLAATADLGLSTEERHPLSRDLCLTNKVFAYLLAGIPQLLAKTRAQADIAPTLGSAALLCDLWQTEDAARLLDSFFSDARQVSAARLAAWDLARHIFCWDKEKEKLLASIQRFLPLARP